MIFCTSHFSSKDSRYNNSRDKDSKYNKQSLSFLEVDWIDTYFFLYPIDFESDLIFNERDLLSLVLAALNCNQTVAVAKTNSLESFLDSLVKKQSNKTSFLKINHIYRGDNFFILKPSFKYFLKRTTKNWQVSEDSFEQINTITI